MKAVYLLYKFKHSNYLRATIHVMGKKRKVGGEEGELVKEAAAPKVHYTAYPLTTDPKS